MKAPLYCCDVALVGESPQYSKGVVDDGERSLSSFG